MRAVLLALILFLSLIIIPLGLPGTWVMIAAAVAYSFWMPDSIGWVTLVGAALIALTAEVLEFALASKYTRKYGGSSRGSWGAIIGGLIGAFIGVPIPIVGPILGGFGGAFAGALAAEYSGGSSAEASTRAATGAVVGRAVAAALKVAMGFVIAAWVFASAIS